MKKAVVVLCVVAVLLAVFGGIVTGKLVQTREELAQRHFDEWYAMYRMTELVEVKGKAESASLLLLVNHMGHYGPANWRLDGMDVRTFLQDYENLLRVVAEAEDSQLAADGYALLEELNGKMKEISGKVLEVCRVEDGSYSGRISPEHPAVKAAMEELKALYGEYLDSLEEIAKRFNEA